MAVDFPLQHLDSRLAVICRWKHFVYWKLPLVFQKKSNATVHPPTHIRFIKKFNFTKDWKEQFKLISAIFLQFLCRRLLSDFSSFCHSILWENLRHPWEKVNVALGKWYWHSLHPGIHFKSRHQLHWLQFKIRIPTRLISNSFSEEEKMT